MILTSTTATYTREEDDFYQALLKRLSEYVEADCHCPCCDTDRHCMGGCTFRDDSPDGWERMVAARKAMWGDKQKGQTE